MKIVDGIIIGSVGGALASLMTIVFNLLKDSFYVCRDKKRIYQWLKQEYDNNEKFEYRTTRAIASWTNLTEDRVRYICSIHKKIHLSVTTKEDSWKLIKDI